MKKILFYDSGVGGISVLREAMKLLPSEHYLYFGDTANAPYGDKSTEEVRALTLANFDALYKKGLRAAVIACNTATSAAISTLREEYPRIPIIGLEPALKPAVEAYPKGRIAVMATSVTLAEEKFASLCREVEGSAKVIPLACPGLMDFVERGELSGGALDSYLAGVFKGVLPLDAVVLGCTHYPFVSAAIKKASGGADVFNGALGAAKRLASLLGDKAITEGAGSVEILNSADSSYMNDLAKKLLKI